MRERGPYRSTYCALVDDPEFQMLTPAARLVLWTLKHGTQGNVAGIFTCYREGLALQTGYDPDTVQAAMDELERRRWVVTAGQLVWVRNQLRFDPSKPLQHANGRKGILNVLRALPRCDLIQNFCHYYNLRNPFEGHPDPIGKGRETPSNSGVRSPESGTRTRTREGKVLSRVRLQRSRPREQTPPPDDSGTGPDPDTEPAPMVIEAMEAERLTDVGNGPGPPTDTDGRRDLITGGIAELRAGLRRLRRIDDGD